jgi:adenine-specific DNA methylase
VIVIPRTTKQALDEFFSTKKDVVYRYMVSQIHKNLRTKTNKVELFVFSNTGIVTAILRQDFKKVLTDAMNHFSFIEDYGFANKCKKMLDRLTVEEYLNEVDSTAQ